MRGRPRMRWKDKIRRMTGLRMGELREKARDRGLQHMKVFE